MSTSALQIQVEKELHQYFDILNGQKPSALHDLVIGQVEEVLFRVVLDYCGCLLYTSPSPRDRG